MLSQFLYVVLLHAGVFNRKYGLGYRNYRGNDHGSGGIPAGHEHQNADTPADLWLPFCSIFHV